MNLTSKNVPQVFNGVEIWTASWKSLWLPVTLCEVKYCHPCTQLDVLGDGSHNAAL